MREPKGVAARITWLMVAMAAASRSLTFGEDDRKMVETLMKPSIPMDGSFGMHIAAVEEQDDRLNIETTGAAFTLYRRTDVIECRQKLGRQRQCVTLRFRDESLRDLTVTAQSSGAVVLSGPKLRLRVNGDSLLMIRAIAPLSVDAELHFFPGYVAVHDGSQLYLDNYGGVGAYPMTAGAEVRIVCAKRRFGYGLPAEGLLWIGVFPPRTFDWEASLRDRLVWHWSRETGYPSNDQLKEWREWGNLYLLQSEVMLWKDWNLGYESRDADSMKRVLDTVHALGGKAMVYTSPGFFLKGTPLERHAINSFDSFRGWPPTVTDGTNIEEFLDAIRRLVRDYHVDGIYFDGLYTKSVARSYRVMSEARRLVGDDGLLMAHCTSNAPGGDVFLPTTDAYANLILRGEGSAVRYSDWSYLRYFVSGYNISNAVGVLCNNDAHPLTPELIDSVLDVNARLSFIVAHDTPQRLRALRERYLPALTQKLKKRVLHALEGANKTYETDFRQRMASSTNAGQMKTIFKETFDSPKDLSQWRLYTTPLEGTAIACRDGRLVIRARENTCANLTLSNDRNVFRVQCRMRIGEHSGASWGPALTLMWPSYFFRVTARTDPSFGIDRPGTQDMIPGLRFGVWYTLRLALDAVKLTCEVREEQGQWRTIWVEPWRGTSWSGTPSHIILGKLSLYGDNTDHEQPGEWGETWIDDLEIAAPIVSSTDKVEEIEAR